MPTIAVGDQPLQFASASGMVLFCLQRRMVSFTFSVGAVAFGAFVCIDSFACRQGFRSRGDRILAGTIAFWNLTSPIAHSQNSGGKKRRDENDSEGSQWFSLALFIDDIEHFCSRIWNIRE